MDRPVIDDDETLLRRMAAGETEALSLLYTRYAAKLLGIGVRVLGDRAEAEDVLHDVFVEVWKRAADFDAARGSARAWLAVRMRSRCLDRNKSPRNARAVAFDEEVAATQRAPDVDPLLRGRRQRVRAAVSTLPGDQQTVLDLAYFQGLSMPEIGERLGVPSGTVKSRLFAARQRLIPLLQDEDDDDDDETRGVP